MELQIIFEFDFTITAKEIKCLLELGIDCSYFIVDEKVVSNIVNYIAFVVFEEDYNIVAVHNNLGLKKMLIGVVLIKTWIAIFTGFLLLK